MIENVIEIKKEQLIEEVQKIKNEGYRFITTSFTDVGADFMIYYHFDKNNEMKHLKITINKKEELPSISGVYFAAALVENEMQDLFGMIISGLALDYGGNFLITGDVEKAPFCTKCE